jgi:hypothetical protein
LLPAASRSELRKRKNAPENKQGDTKKAKENDAVIELTQKGLATERAILNSIHVHHNHHLPTAEI